MCKVTKGAGRGQASVGRALGGSVLLQASGTSLKQERWHQLAS